MRAMAAILSAAALALSGCASVSYSDKGGRTMVDVTNTAWYLLNLIPLASGNPDAPNEISCRILTQTTTLENNVRLLDFAVTERGAASVRSVGSYWTDESILFILFKRHTIHTSAELVFADDDANPICESQNR